MTGMEEFVRRVIPLSTVRSWLPAEWGTPDTWQPAEVALNDEVQQLKSNIRREKPLDEDLFRMAVCQATIRHYYSGVSKSAEENATLQTTVPKSSHHATGDLASSQETQARRIRPQIPLDYHDEFGYNDKDDDDYNHNDAGDDNDDDSGQTIHVAKPSKKRARNDNVNDPMQLSKKQKRQDHDLVSDLRKRLSDNNTLLVQGSAPKGLVRRATGWPMTGPQSEHIQALCRAISDHQAQCYQSMKSTKARDDILKFCTDQENAKASAKQHWMKEWSDPYMQALDRLVTQILPSPSTLPTSSAKPAIMTSEYSTGVAGNSTLSSCSNPESRRGSGVPRGDRSSPVAWASFYQPR